MTAEARVGQQGVNQALALVEALVIEEGAGFGAGGGQAHGVEVDAAQELFVQGAVGGLHAVTLPEPGDFGVDQLGGGLGGVGGFRNDRRLAAESQGKASAAGKAECH